MKYGLDASTAGTYANARLLADLAADAEAAGWDGFFVWDAIFAHPPRLSMVDPWVALAAIAMQTEHIKIGALVTPLARRRPWLVARQAVSLDHLSHGRLILGVGLGYQDREFTAFGEDADPRTRGDELDEALDVITGLWSGKKLDFRGAHYQVDGVKFLPRPLQSPRIPIWVAGYWPNRRPFRRAARYDGLLPGKVPGIDLSFDELRECLVYVQRHRTGSGPFDVGIYGHTPSGVRRAVSMVKPWQDAGATWWREGIGDWRGDLKAVRRRIRSGPPRS